MPGRGKHGPRAEPLQPVASPQPLPHQGQLQSPWRQLQEELAGDNLGLEASDATPSVWVEPAEPRPPPNLTKESGGACCGGIMQVAMVATFVMVAYVIVEFEPPPGSIVLALVGACLCGCCAVIECCANAPFNFLVNMKSDAAVYEHVSTVRRAAPTIVWTMECYHYELRKAGRGQVEHKVVTHEATLEYHAWFWEDVTPAIPDLSQAPLIGLEFAKAFQFADDASLAHFTRAKQGFQAENTRDAKQKFTEKLKIDGYEAQVLGSSDLTRVPGWMSAGWYWVCSCCCLTVPYRMAFAKRLWKAPPSCYTKVLYGPGASRREYSRNATDVVAPTWPPPAVDAAPEPEHEGGSVPVAHLLETWTLPTGPGSQDVAATPLGPDAEAAINGPDVEAPHVPGVLAASPGEQTALISITQPRCQWWRVTPHVSRKGHHVRDHPKGKRVGKLYRGYLVHGSPYEGEAHKDWLRVSYEGRTSATLFSEPALNRFGILRSGTTQFLEPAGALDRTIDRRDSPVSIEQYEQCAKVSAMPEVSAMPVAYAIPL